MPLEDHLGDIIRKGRWHTGVSLEEAAKAAGLHPAALKALENDGVLQTPVDFVRLGKLLRLNPDKLRQIADGWQPAPVNLASWQHLRTIATGTGSFLVNCYLVWDGPTRQAALFDTGFDAQPVLQVVRDFELALRLAFFTHNHLDHVAAWPQIHAACPKTQRWPEPGHTPAGMTSHTFAVGELRISVRQTPGHTDDGFTYIVSNWPDNAPIVAFVGDALFAGSMGKAPERPEIARQSIVTQIFSLPDSTLICPGHGPLTTVAEELAHNPFF